MSTLTEFLLARIDEDQTDAMASAPPRGSDDLSRIDVEAVIDGANAAIAHRRRLAEAAAKRRIVELHRLEVFHQQAYNTDGGARVPIEPDSVEDIVTRRVMCLACKPRFDLATAGEVPEMPDGPCDTLKALAAIYAEHPDYRQEWRP